jgi:hypothetical protein
MALSEDQAMSDAGAMAEAEPKWLIRARERIEASKPFKVGSDIHLLEMAADAYVASTRREAAAFARGVQVVCKIADAEVDKLRPTDWRAEVGTGFKTAQRIASAARALLGEGKK